MIKRIVSLPPEKKDLAKATRPNSRERHEPVLQPTAILRTPRQTMSADTVLHLQRTIGNRAVSQLIKTQRQRSPNAGPVAKRIQRMTSVKVAGGTFSTDTKTDPVSDVSKDKDKLLYAPMKGLFNPEASDSGMQIGAIMKLKFVPDGGLKPKDKTKPPTIVSLVQTVHDTVQVNGQPVDRPAAGFGLRQTPTGPTIDQTLYKDTGNQIDNLDPRYTESRMNDAEPVTKKIASVSGTAGHSINSDDDTLWTQGAMLRDNPGAVNPPSMAGNMRFEVAALIKAYDPHNDNVKEYFGGSIAWGWDATGTNGLMPQINPNDITIVDNASASAVFFQAVTAWNNMAVPTTKGQVGGQTVAPLQLPGALGATSAYLPRAIPQAAITETQIREVIARDDVFTGTIDNLILALTAQGSITPEQDTALRSRIKFPAGSIKRITYRKEIPVIFGLK